MIQRSKMRWWLRNANRLRESRDSNTRSDRAGDNSGRPSRGWTSASDSSASICAAGRHRSLPIGLCKPVPFALKGVGRQRDFRSGIQALYAFPTDVSAVDIKRAEALQRLFLIAFSLSAGCRTTPPSNPSGIASRGRTIQAEGRFQGNAGVRRQRALKAPMQIERPDACGYASIPAGTWNRCRRSRR